MSYEHHSIARLRVATEDSFATDCTSSAMSKFTDVAAIEGSIEMQLIEEMLNPETIQQVLDGTPTYKAGLKSASLSFAMNLASTGTAAGDSTQQVQGSLGKILSAVMGVENLGTGADAEASPAPTAATFSVGAGEGAANLFDPGAAVGVLRGATGTSYAVREIQTRSTDAVTLKLELDNAVETSDVIYASASYAMSLDPQNSLQFAVEGYEADDAWIIFGSQLQSMAIDMPLGNFPRITFGMQAANWGQADGASATVDLTGGAPSAASITNHSPVHFTGEAIYGTAGTEALASATKLVCSELTIEPQFTYQPIRSPNGTQTIARYRRSRTAPGVTGSFVVPFEDATYFTARSGEGNKFLFVQMGTTAGKTVLVSLPSIQIVNVERIDADGIAAQRVSFHSRTDQDSGGSTALADSPFRIHLL